MEKFKDLKYERPDFEKVNAELLDCAEKMKAAASYEDFRAVYLKAEKILLHIHTMDSICYIRNTLDKTDEYYEKENAAMSEGQAKLAMAEKKLSEVMISSPWRADFDREFGPHITRKKENQINLVNEAIVPDMVEEDRLGQVYAKDAALCKTTFRGEECNFYGLLKHMQSTDRDERREAFHAWADLYESVSDKLDATYDQLVALRVAKAKKLGFDSYIDYIYPARGRFDYTAREAECFRNQVRDVIVPLCKELHEKQAKRLGIDQMHWYDESLIFPEGNATPIGTKDELVAKALNMYKQLSPETGEYFTFMTDHELFDLDTRPGKHLGGYCTSLPDYKAPFIFSNFNGTSADVDVLTHEAGHAFQSYISIRTLPLAEMCHSTSEINEIHSMSMEHFAYPWMDSFFGDKADEYRYAHLVDALCTIPYLVSVDEFQHRVFERPDMTAAERRAVWHEIETIYLPWRDYDGNKFLEEGGFWMQKQHIFLYPFYYIDYALAQICAFQFLLRDREDHEQAWQGYLNLCRRGGSMGYFDLLESAGLMNPLKEGTVSTVIEGVRKVIDEFEAKI